MGDAALGGITLDDAKTWMSDHDHHPTGICRHSGGKDPSVLTIPTR